MLQGVKVRRLQKKNWTFDETKILVDTMISFLGEKPQDPRLFKKRDMLVKLEHELHTRGVNRDAYQIAIKIKNMKSSYFRATDAHLPTGNAIKMDEFMDEMSYIFDGGRRSSNHRIELAEFRDPLESGVEGIEFIKKEECEEESFDNFQLEEELNTPNLSTRDPTDCSPEPVVPGPSSYSLDNHLDRLESRKRKKSGSSDIVLATKMFIDAQKEMFREQARRDTEEAEKDRALLEKILDSLKK